MARLKGNDDLFRLIHALTTEEKGYFKKFAKRHTSKGNKHLELFDAINAQKEFEEEGLKKKFKGYADMKVYLFEMILQCLSLYQGGRTPLFDMLQKMVYSVILQNKGLQRKAIQVNQEGMELARSKDFFWLWEQFFRHDMVFTELRWADGEQLENYKQAFAQIKQIRDMQDNRDAYILAGHYALHVKQKETVKGRHNYRIDDLVDIGFLEDAGKVLTRSNERNRLFALGRYYNAKDNHKKAHEAYKELYKLERVLIESKDPGLSRLYLYLAHRTLITSCLRVGSYKDMPELLEGLLAVDNFEKRYELDARYFYCLRYADYYWQTGKHKQGLEFYNKRLDVILKGHKEDVNAGQKITLMSRKILFHYSQQNYTDAILAIEDLYEAGVKQIAPQYRKQAEWIRMLIHLQADDLKNVKAQAKLLLQTKDLELLDWEKPILEKLLAIQSSNRQAVVKQCMKTYSNAEAPLLLFENFNLHTALKHIATKNELPELVQADFKFSSN